MIKDTWDKNENASANKKEITVLKEHFPACFKKDGSFDLERFKEYLSEDINVVNEGYELKFLGKNYARLLVTLETDTVIVPNEEHNQKKENKDSENIYITGDNLDGLKHLLKSYAGKVKCIYIDPPYNTGEDGFVYNDNFNFTVEELTEKLSIGEEEAKRILDLTKRGSASHSAWLMFMYPRMQLARDLLTEDGVVFISIDDNEQANLKLICDDIFGEMNFEGHVHWRRRYNQPNDKTKLIGLVAEHLLVYSRDNKKLKESGVGKIGLTGKFSNPDNDPRGDWASKPWKVGSNQSGSNYKIVTPTGVVLEEEWMGDEKSYKSLLDDNRIYFPQGGNGSPRKKYFRYEREFEGQCANNWWIHENFGHNQQATIELEELFGFKHAFTNPKPLKLLENILSLANLNENDIVLDFFSGSATTAHASFLHSLNIKNKFIMIQLPEKIDKLFEKSTGNERHRLENVINMLDSKNSNLTLDEVGIERIKRSAKKIERENPDSNIDLGFKHFTLKEPSNKTINKLVDFNPQETKLFSDNTLLDEFGVSTVITTWLNNDGYGLTSGAEKVLFADYDSYYKDKHLYLLHPELTNEAIEELVVKYETDGDFNPENIVLFGYSFTWTEIESLKTNLKRLQDTEKNLRINFDIRY